MKKLPLAIALLLLISATGMILIKRSGRDLDVLPPKDSPTSAIVPTPLSSLAETFTARTRPRRPTLEDSLPPGSKVIESKKIPSGIEVILADGSHISAAGASVTSSGISFKGPYKFTAANRLLWISGDAGGVFLLARDGSSFKMIGTPDPEGTTTSSGSAKIMEAEHVVGGNGG